VCGKLEEEEYTSLQIMQISEREEFNMNRKRSFYVSVLFNFL
jgi:hypothetical protein